MTSVSSTNPSMRFSLDEVLSGMLASIKSDTFTDDGVRIASVFEKLAKEFPLCAPMAAAVDPSAAQGVLDKLVHKDWLLHKEGQYELTAIGRGQCVGSKKMLFSQVHMAELEAAAKVFDTI